MKIAVLLPFCPLPADSGSKVLLWKHLLLMKELGECTVVSAGGKPVGAGWTPEARKQVEGLGIRVVLREENCPRSPRQWAGIAYAAVCKGLGLERAFGHSNPYHRQAFPAAWWARQVAGSDLAVIPYSYWAHLPCPCPKVVVVHDLWSENMWEGPARETADLRQADLLAVISKDDELTLHRRGLHRTFWLPPLVPPQEFPDSVQMGMVGSANRMNLRGLRWLERGMPPGAGTVNVYGSIAGKASGPAFVRKGRYQNSEDPFRECGVVLLPTAEGTGVQVKAVEALACGRAVVARRGAMRGLERKNPGWLEVDTPQEMMRQALRLAADPELRNRQYAAAREYYRSCLDHDRLVAGFLKACTQLVR